MHELDVCVVKVETALVHCNGHFYSLGFMA